jgi:hypothetical protein
VSDIHITIEIRPDHLCGAGHVIRCNSAVLDPDKIAEQIRQVLGNRKRRGGGESGQSAVKS